MSIKQEKEKRSNRASSNIWAAVYRNLNNLPHWHREAELVVCCEGEVKAKKGEKEYLLKAGEALLAEPRVPHQLISEKPSLIVISKFSTPSSLELLKNRRLKEEVFIDNYHLKEQLCTIEKELREARPFYKEKTEGILLTILSELYRELGENAQEEKERSNNRYEELLQKINQEYRTLTFPEAAAFLNMSTSAFSRYFHKYSGHTFSEYLNLVRIDKAIELLEKKKELQISEVGYLVGYETLRHFQRTFKALTGYSPTKLPQDFSLSFKSYADERNSFDPTLPSSILL